MSVTKYVHPPYDKCTFRNSVLWNSVNNMKKCTDAGVKFTQEELEHFLVKACYSRSHGAIHYLLELGAPCYKKHLNTFIERMDEQKFKNSINVIKKLLRSLVSVDPGDLKLIPVSDLANIFIKLDMNALMHKSQIKEIFDIFIEAGAEPIILNSKEFNKYFNYCNNSHNYIYGHNEYDYCPRCDDVCKYDEYNRYEALQFEGTRKRNFLQSKTKHEFILRLIDDHCKGIQNIVNKIDINDCSETVCEYLFKKFE